jgi:methionyl aminopeptidase
MPGWFDWLGVRRVEILRSPREIAQMRKAGLVVWEAFQIARSLVRPGVATAEIDLALERFYAESQAEPLFKFYPNSTEGGAPFPAVTCISINREVVHGIPGKRKLVEGDIVSIDTGCKLSGWCGDAATTFAVGAIPPRTQQLLDVTRGALHLAIKLMGEKKWWSEVAEAMQNHVRVAGFSVVEDFVGHGIGRSMHEDPQVPNFVKRGYRRSRNDFRLVPGLVIAVEPMVNMGTKEVRVAPDQWTQVTVDGQPSAHFEHTIAVTESGPQVLTAGPNGESW